MKIKTIFTNIFIHSAVLFLPFSLNVEDHVEVIEPQVEMAENSVVFNLPEVRIRPDSPLYDLKRSWEEIRLFLSNDPEQKIELLLQIANTRLAEATTLLKSQNTEGVAQVLEDYESTMNKVETLRLQTESDKTTDTRIDATKHKESLVKFVTGEYQVQWQR